MSNASNTKRIKTEFNDLAVELGCTARLAGNAKKIEFQEFIGTYSADGYEFVVKISAERFGKLIAKYPQLNKF